MLLKNQRLRIGLLSIVVGSIILALKFWAYHITGSAALKSDALESVVNVVAAIFAFGAIVFAERPADESHPYGHGKIENFSAAFEGGLISLAAVLIFYEAVRAFLEGPRVMNLDAGLALNFIAGVMNGVLGAVLIRFGKKKNSKAIEADGHHVMSDFYTTLGLMAGLLVVRFTGFYWLDPLLAAFVGVVLAYTGFKLVRDSSAALLDEEDPELIARLVATMNETRTDAVIEVHALRTLRSGRHTHIDIHVAVPEFFSLEEAHDTVKTFGNKTVEILNLEGEFHTHVDPCKKLYCEQCAVAPCAVRRQPFKNKFPLSVEKAVAMAPIVGR